MKIEVLISTMDLKNYKKLINNMNINNCIIINQTQNSILNNIVEGNQKVFSYKEKGLSRSRNRGIKNATGDICVIADDDLKYSEDYEKTIEEGYKKYPDADIIAFYVDNIQKSKKRPIRRETKINFIKSMRIQSVQITFKRKSIIDKNIRFNERFGAGSELYMGEENIFLSECLKKGLKIYYIPKTIATIQDNESSWFKGHNEYNFNVKGAVYYEISKVYYPILILQFALRKRKIYVKEVKTFKAIQYMFNGAKKYKISKKKKIYMMGDFVSNTGPAIVNKHYYEYLKDYVYICNANNKLKRVLHFFINIMRCDVLLISGLSKFHSQSCNIAKKLRKKVIYLMHGYDKIEYELNEVPIEKRKLIDTEEKILQLSDKIICVSEKFSEYMKKERKDLESKIDFVNNGICEIKSYKNEVNLDKKFTIISVGRRNEKKKQFSYM